eukprot:jgi/Tetstr1/420381/TSEL_011497.t1
MASEEGSGEQGAGSAMEAFVCAPAGGRAEAAEALLAWLSEGGQAVRRCEAAVAAGGEPLAAALLAMLGRGRGTLPSEEEEEEEGEEMEEEEAVVAAMEVAQLLASASVASHAWLAAARPLVAAAVARVAAAAASMAAPRRAARRAEELQAALELCAALARLAAGREALLACPACMGALLDAVAALAPTLLLQPEASASADSARPSKVQKVDAGDGGASPSTSGATDDSKGEAAHHQARAPLCLTATIPRLGTSPHSIALRETAVEGVNAAAACLAALWSSERGPRLGELPAEGVAHAAPGLRALWAASRRGGGLPGVDRASVATCVMRLAMEQRAEAAECGALAGGRTPAGPLRGEGGLLAWLLGSTGLGAFFRDHWEAAPLHVRGEPGRFAWLGIRAASAIGDLVDSDLRCPDMEATAQDPVEALAQRGTEGDRAEAGVLALRCTHAEQSKAEHWMGGAARLAAAEAQRAFEAGFTIAIRGLAYRSEGARALVSEIGAEVGLFAGVNAYLTPPGATGLPAHYDDHDVLVLQLSGAKLWRLRAPAHPGVTLPRLYEPREAVRSLTRESGGSTPGVQEVLLQEGDALYVPRGWAHQATAPPADPERGASEPPPPSLHLSLGLEVEPLQDWAGAAHVALRQHVLALLAGSGSPPGTAGGLALRVADAQARHRLLRAESALHAAIYRAAGRQTSLRAACPWSSSPELAAHMTAAARCSCAGGAGAAACEWARSPTRQSASPAEALLRCHLRHAVRAGGGSGAVRPDDDAGAPAGPSTEAGDAPFWAWLPLVRHPELEEGPGRSPPHVEVPCQDEDWKEEAEGNLATELAASLLARSHSDAHGVWENVRREVRRLVAVTRGARELVHAAHLALR